MTRIPNLKYHQFGNLYGLRNWVEYGLKKSKNEHEKGQIFASRTMLKSKSGGRLS